MNPLKTIADGYRRLRHTYGFGVHSPSAFSLVNNVLIDRKGYTYYDLDHIEASAGSFVQRRRARILHRLAAHYPCGEFIIDRSLPKAWRVALAPARFCRGNGTFLVKRDLPDYLPDEGIVAAFDLSKDDLLEFEEMMTYGVLLEGKDAAIAMLNPKTRFVKYTVKI